MRKHFAQKYLHKYVQAITEGFNNELVTPGDFDHLTLRVRDFYEQLLATPTPTIPASEGYVTLQHMVIMDEVLRFYVRDDPNNWEKYFHVFHSVVFDGTPHWWMEFMPLVRRFSLVVKYIDERRLQDINMVEFEVDWLFNLMKIDYADASYYYEGIAYAKDIVLLTTLKLRDYALTLMPNAKLDAIPNQVFLGDFSDDHSWLIHQMISHPRTTIAFAATCPKCDPSLANSDK